VVCLKEVRRTEYQAPGLLVQEGGTELANRVIGCTN